MPLKKLNKLETLLIENNPVSGNDNIDEIIENIVNYKEYLKRV